MKRSALIAFALCLGLFCSVASAPGAELSAFVSILPQKYFLEKIGGEHVKASVMVRPGASPATYEPKPRQMAGLSKAQLYFSMGVPFEKAWLPRFASANPGMTIVHSEQGIDKQPLQAHVHSPVRPEKPHREHASEGGGHEHEHHAEEAGHGHGHGHEQGHSHEQGIPDPHVWLSPPLAVTIARNMHDALAAADPEHAAAYAANLAAFEKECQELDQELRQLLAGLHPPHNVFMVFHPSWGYFAAAYGLEQVAIEIEGKEPSPAELKQLIDLAREEEISVVFVQPQFSRKSAELIADSIEGTVAPLDPLAEEWRDNLLAAGKAISQAVRRH